MPTTATPTAATKLSYATNDPGECFACGNDVYDDSDDCDMPHGEYAAYDLADDNYQFFTLMLDEELTKLVGRRTGGAHIRGENMGWLHRTGETYLPALDAAKLLDKLTRNLSDWSMEVLLPATDGKLVVHLWHHDAPFNPEVFTVTPLTAAEGRKMAAEYA